MADSHRTLVLGGTFGRATDYAHKAGLKRHEWVWIYNASRARGWSGTFDLVDLGPAPGSLERERYQEAAEVLHHLEASGMLTVAQRLGVSA